MADPDPSLCILVDQRRLHLLEIRSFVRQRSRVIASLAMVLAILPANMATAQSRLPALVRTTSFIAGQLLGCVLRTEAYFALVSEELTTAGRPMPANVTGPNIVAGLDLDRLKSDLEAALLQFPDVQSPGTLEAMKELIHTVAITEYGSRGNQQSPVNSSWVQMAGCGQSYHQLGLYELYPLP